MRSLAYQSAYALALVLLSPQALFSRKWRALYRGRVGLTARVRRWRLAHPGRLFWFHVASSGELEQCLPILEEIKKRSPEVLLALSYFSPTGRAAVALEVRRREVSGLPLPWDFADFSPWDLAPSARGFIRALRPSSFIAIHREVWPMILQECERAEVQRYLFSSYVPEFSERRLRWLRPWVAKFQFIGTTSASSEGFYRELLGSRAAIAVGGDPRIERVLKRKEFALGKTGLLNFDPELKNFVAASIWREDFEALKPGLEEELLVRTDWRLILVPHEPDPQFIAQMREWLQTRGESVRLWSELEPGQLDDSHLIVDKVGFLAELYRAASLVFVGGSFKKRVHNVLEPAAYGCPILTGPYIENSGEAVELAQHEKGLVVAANAEDFQKLLGLLMEDEQGSKNIAHHASQYLAERREAPRFYAERLLAAYPMLTQTI